MPKKNDKVIRYRRPKNINVGMIIFLIFFLYLVYNIGTSFTRTRVQVYEVGQISSVVKDPTYTGLILRQETTYTTERAGYVNYYVKASSRTGVGNTVYSIDSDGTFTSTVTDKDSDQATTLTEEQQDTLKAKLAAFSASYTNSQFHTVYDMKYSVENLLLNYLSAEALAGFTEGGSGGNFTTVTADKSGIVEYYQDGYETKTEADLTAQDFYQSNYTNNQISSGSMLSKNSFVYKVITSESWVVYLPLTEEDVNELTDRTKVYLHFNDVNLDAAAEFELIQTSDGTMLGKCSLSRYMNQLADRRYASVTLMNSRSDSVQTGLKIPKTSVIQKDFYVVPDIFAAIGGENSSIGFLVENGTNEPEFISPDIYAHIDQYYFIDMDTMEDGITLIRPSDTILEEEASGDSDTDEEETSEDETSEDATESSEETESAEEESETMETETEETESSASVEETESTQSELPPISEDAVSYKVGRTHQLNGTLSVNKGYCVFKQITILDEADDYYIVQSGQSYGLAVYDHILLDGTSAKEGDIIYQ